MMYWSIYNIPVFAILIFTRQEMNGEDLFIQWCPDMKLWVRNAKVGSHVKKFKAGDTAGVGVMIDSCSVCKPC